MSEEPRQTFMLMGVRLGRYVNLIEPRKNQKPRADGTKPAEKFEVEIIMAKNHPQAAEVRAEQRAAAERRWGVKANDMLTALLARDRVFLHNGDATRIGKPEYADSFYMTAKNKDQPTIIVSEKGVNIATRGTPKVLLPSHPNYPYPGCLANLELDIYAYDQTTDDGQKVQGISATILGVQYAGPGERLGMQTYSSPSRFGIVASDVDGAAPVHGNSEHASLI